MEKYLLPWIIFDWTRIRRYSLIGKRNLIASVHKDEYLFDYRIFLFTLDKSTVSYIECNFSSLSKAKERADQKLIEEGYILIPEDKVEQYKVLL